MNSPVVGEADRGVDRPAQLAVLRDALALRHQLADLVGVAGTVEIQGAWVGLTWVWSRLAIDRRSGRLRDSKIIIDFKIVVGVVLHNRQWIAPVMGWNHLESGNRVQKSGRDHDR